MKYFFSLLIMSCLLTTAVQAQFDRNTSTKKQTTKDDNNASTKEEDEQEEEKGFSKKKLFVGGGLGLNFGTQTYIQVAPRVGYRFTKKLNAGVSFNYVYNRYKGFDDRRLPIIDIGNTLGAGVFANYMLFNNIFGSAEFEHNKYWFSRKANNQNYKLTESYPSFLIGAGIHQKLGLGIGLNFQLLYDVLQLNPLYYRQPVVRGGVFFGL
jgi:hypothetical protein